MVSLTPASRADEVTGDAMNEGLVNGGLVFAPSVGALYFAMQNPQFRKVRDFPLHLLSVSFRFVVLGFGVSCRVLTKRKPHFSFFDGLATIPQFTNWQSRTAMVIMPALFAFALTSEHKMADRMREVANETEHALQTVEWADREHRRRQQQSSSQQQSETELRKLYKQAVLESAIRVVPGNTLGAHHRMANYVQENPFKLLAAVGVPAVAYIFYGRTTKEHLNFQMRLLHTRVYGQFTIICSLLSIMGIKEFMDRR